MKKLEVLYEDDHIIVINKRAGMLSIGDRFTFNIPSILSQLKKQYGDIFTVHRLDKDTSGAIVFAKNAEAHKHLSQQFENKKVEKKYYAFVEGIPPSKGTIDEPIAESVYVPGKMVVHKKGKPSLTHFETVNTFGNISLIDVALETGRTHQIRVHMKHLGHPLFIDPKYGNRSEFYLSELKGRKYRLGKDREERPFIKRLTLHAYELTIAHPATNKKLTFTAEFPKDLRALNHQLTKLFGNKDA